MSIQSEKRHFRSFKETSFPSETNSELFSSVHNEVLLQKKNCHYKIVCQTLFNLKLNVLRRTLEFS